MLNPKLKLNPKLFNQDVEQVPIRKGFGQGLLAAGEADASVVGLCADLTESTQMNLFADKLYGLRKSIRIRSYYMHNRSDCYSKIFLSRP